MAQILDLKVCDTSLEPRDFNSIHSDLEPSSPKKLRKPHQAASAWRITNFLKSVDSCHVNPSSDLPDTMCLNGSNSIIVIQDDSSLQGNCQTEPNVITVSDSESECLSLPDIEEPFDFYDHLTQSASCSSLILLRDDDIKCNSFPLNSAVSPTSGHSNQSAKDSSSCSHSETKEHDAQNFIYISEDSLDSDLIEITSGEEDFKATLNDSEETSNEGSCKDLRENSLVSIQRSHCKRENGWLDESSNNFVIDTSQYICKDNNQGSNVCTSALDSKQGIVNGSLPLSTFVDYILPYSLQPYTRNTNLGVKDFKDQPQVSVELIQSCLEEGKQFALCTANISCLYLYAYRPTQSSLEDLLTWLQQRDVGFTLENEGLLRLPYFKLYGLLNELFHCYPENVFILWDAICGRMLTVPLEENVFLNFALTLEICLNVLEGEFFQLQDPKKCQVYRLVANNESYSNIKKIIWWLSQVVTILIDKNLTLAEQVLCQLEKLLELVVAVSLRNGRLAKRIAKDLVGIYLSIPYLNFRQRFLSTIQSDLIRFKLLEILLEKYCGGTMLGWSYMPESIADIAESFFQATPMENHLLDDCIVVNLDGLDNMSPSRCEELIMLIYFAIISYMVYLQGSFHNPLLAPPDSERFCPVVDFEPVCNGYIPPPWGNLLSQLKDFPLYISQLNQHIRNFNVELSKRSLLYLKMLDHLTDLMAEDLTLSVF